MDNLLINFGGWIALILIGAGRVAWNYAQGKPGIDQVRDEMTQKIEENAAKYAVLQNELKGRIGDLEKSGKEKDERIKALERANGEKDDKLKTYGTRIDELEERERTLQAQVIVLQGQVTSLRDAKDAETRRANEAERKLLDAQMVASNAINKMEGYAEALAHKMKQPLQIVVNIPEKMAGGDQTEDVEENEADKQKVEEQE